MVELEQTTGKEVSGLNLYGLPNLILKIDVGQMA
jgi:hypothetical protein